MKSLEVKWLLGARADAEKPVEADLTPLRLAARFGNDEVVDAWRPFPSLPVERRSPEKLGSSFRKGIRITQNGRRIQLQDLQ